MKRFLKDTICFMVEFIHQIAYVGFVLAILFILCNLVTTKELIIYIISLLIHLGSIAFWGNRMFYPSDYNSTEEKMMSHFIIFNCILLMITGLLTNIIISAIIYISLSVLYILYVFFTERLICCTNSEKRPKLEILFEKHPHFWYFILMLIPVIAIIATLLFLPWNIFIKIGIVVVYILLMPVIAMAADNGFDMQDIISYFFGF